MDWKEGGARKCARVAVQQNLSVESLMENKDGCSIYAYKWILNVPVYCKMLNKW